MHLYLYYFLKINCIENNCIDKDYVSVFKTLNSNNHLYRKIRKEIKQHKSDDLHVFWFR